MEKTCGSGQCVDFVKADTDVPRQTKDWAPGAKAGTKTPGGAAIATFGPNGKYENKVGQSHAAELVSVAPNGKSAVIRQEGGPANQLKDRPASFNGVSQTVTATSVLGGVSGHTFSPKGAMTWGYSVNGKGGVSMIGPRVATPGEYKNAVTILRNASAGTGWQVQ